MKLQLFIIILSKGKPSTVYSQSWTKDKVQVGDDGT